MNMTSSTCEFTAEKMTANSYADGDGHERFGRRAWLSPETMPRTMQCVNVCVCVCPQVMPIPEPALPVSTTLPDDTVCVTYMCDSCEKAHHSDCAAISNCTEADHHMEHGPVL